MGLVQGVYFRETTRRIALGYAVTGFVRNVGSDRVEIEAEGETAVVEAFITDVLAHPPPRARIDSVERAATNHTGDDSAFLVAPTVSWH